MTTFLATIKTTDATVNALTITSLLEDGLRDCLRRGATVEIDTAPVAAGRDTGPSILAERLTAYQVFLLLKLLESAVTELTTGSHYQRIALADKITNDVAALKAVHAGDANPPAAPAIPSGLLEAADDALQCLYRLPDVDRAYRVTCIAQLEKAITAARAQASTDAGIESMQSDTPVSAGYLAELERSLAECEAEMEREHGAHGIALTNEIADLRAGIAAAKASRAGLPAFAKGDTVIASPADAPNKGWVGTIVSIRNDGGTKLYTVQDADDDCWDCEASEIVLHNQD